MKKKTIAAGALLGSVLVLSGCRLDVDLGDQEQAITSYDVGGSLTALEVHTDSGDIEVNESDRSGVRVTETLHWTGDQRNRPKTEHPVSGGTLTLSQECSGGNCSVDYKVEVPRGLKATLGSSAGDVTMRALTGEVNAHAASGDIEAASTGAKRFVAVTGSGDVELRFDAVPDHVEIETGSGDAAVRLPRADYNVTAETGSGERTVKVTDVPSSSHRVSVRAGAGSVDVLPS